MGWAHCSVGRSLAPLVYGPAQPAVASHCWLGRIAEWVRTQSFLCSDRYPVKHEWHICITLSWPLTKIEHNNGDIYLVTIYIHCQTISMYKIESPLYLVCSHVPILSSWKVTLLYTILIVLIWEVSRSLSATSSLTRFCIKVPLLPFSVD